MNAAIKEIAELLLRARASRTGAEVPHWAPPREIPAAYAVQDEILRAIGPVGGWKVGASSPEAEPLCAPLPRSLLFESPMRFPADQFRNLGLEAEIAFRIGRDLPPREAPYSREEVAEAIAAALPVIEVVDSRWRKWPDVPAIWQTADLQSHGALICGPECADWRGLDLLHQPVRVTVDRHAIVEKVGGNKAGDILRLVTWLANHATGRRGGLKAGEIVTTGSCTGLEFAQPGTTVIADFGDLGRSEVTFSRAAA